MEFDIVTIVIGLVVGLAATAVGLMTRFWLLAPKPCMAGEPAL